MSTSEIILAILGSNGLFTLIQFFISRHDKSKKADADMQKAQSRMLMGLAHDRIMYLGNYYIQRGYITDSEYEDLNKYLYEPYQALNGNGTAKKKMEEVRKLPSVVPLKNE